VKSLMNSSSVTVISGLRGVKGQLM
jgi:hypothetical protein